MARKKKTDVQREFSEEKVAIIHEQAITDTLQTNYMPYEIGRASCRERV